MAHNLPLAGGRCQEFSSSSLDFRTTSAVHFSHCLALFRAASAQRQTRGDSARVATDSGTFGGPRRILGRLRAELRPLVPSRRGPCGAFGRRSGPSGPAMVSRREPLPASVRVTPPGHTKRDDPLKASVGLSASTSPFPHPGVPAFRT